MSVVILLPAALCSNRHILGPARWTTLLGINITSEEFGGIVKCSPMRLPCWSERLISLKRVSTFQRKWEVGELALTHVSYPSTTPLQYNSLIVTVDNDDDVLPFTTSMWYCRHLRVKFGPCTCENSIDIISLLAGVQVSWTVVNSDVDETRQGRVCCGRKVRENGSLSE